MVQDRGLTVGVIHTPYRVWGRAGVLTERRGGGRDGPEERAHGGSDTYTLQGVG